MENPLFGIEKSETDIFVGVGNITALFNAILNIQLTCINAGEEPGGVFHTLFVDSGQPNSRYASATLSHSEITRGRETGSSLWSSSESCRSAVSRHSLR